MEIDYEGYGKIICAALLHDNCIYIYIYQKKDIMLFFLWNPLEY